MPSWERDAAFGCLLLTMGGVGAGAVHWSALFLSLVGMTVVLRVVERAVGGYYQTEAADRVRRAMETED